jgi:hypothetical protein
VRLTKNNAQRADAVAAEIASVEESLGRVTSHDEQSWTHMLTVIADLLMHTQRTLRHHGGLTELLRSTIRKPAFCSRMVAR